MKLKRMTWLLTACAGMLVASCSNDDSILATGSNDVITFTVNPDLNVKTRAVPPPSMVPTGKKLRYIMEVYNVEGTTMTLNSRTVKVVADETTPATFTWQRPTGSTYKAVFWADLTLQASEEDDAYYDTSSGLNNITFVSSNTDNFDGEAFFGHIDISSETATAESVTLTHAVSLVTLNTTQQLIGFGSVKVSYGEAGNANAPVSSFNAVNGTAGTTHTTIEKVNTVSSSEMTGPSSPYNFHNFYLFAPTDAQGVINMKVTMCSDATGGTEVQSANIPNVPLRANYKTNITGDFAQATDAFSISCSDAWGGQLRTASVWDGTVPTGNTGGSAFSGGTGAEDNAYIIGCAADLAQLAADVNAGCDYNGKYFEQNVDMDMNGTNYNWTPIGTDSKPFKANYDGGGYKIINLKVNMPGNSDYAGFLGYAEGDIVIKNIHVSGEVSSLYIAGGICGEMSEFNGTTSGKISGCSFSGSVTGPYSGGGICGYAGNNTIITACANYGTVTSSQGGGIVGVTDSGSIVAGCYNTGTVNPDGSSSSNGGIIGVGYAAVGCYNTGVISGAYINSVAGHTNTIDCFTTVEYGGTKSGTTVFGSSAWPAYNDSGSSWYVDAAPDGSYTNNSTTFSNCKFWKSGGDWNGGTPIYPKLWWEK